MIKDCGKCCTGITFLSYQSGIYNGDFYFVDIGKV